MFKKKIFIILTMGIWLSLQATEKTVSFRDSSFEELHTGYIGVYNPETKTVLCTKVTRANGPEEIEFSGVKATDCLEVCTGRMIGTCTNEHYNPCQSTSNACEPPFFVLSIDESARKIVEP